MRVHSCCILTLAHSKQQSLSPNGTQRTAWGGKNLLHDKIRICIGIVDGLCMELVGGTKGSTKDASSQSGLGLIPDAHF